MVPKSQAFLTFLFQNNSQPIYLLEKNTHGAILIIAFLLILNDNKRVVECDISVWLYTQVVKHWFHVVFWINELKTRKQVQRQMFATFSSINIFFNIQSYTKLFIMIFIHLSGFCHSIIPFNFKFNHSFKTCGFSKCLNGHQNWPYSLQIQISFSCLPLRCQTHPQQRAFWTGCCSLHLHCMYRTLCMVSVDCNTYSFLLYKVGLTHNHTSTISGQSQGLFPLQMEVVVGLELCFFHRLQSQSW